MAHWSEGNLNTWRWVFARIPRLVVRSGIIAPFDDSVISGKCTSSAIPLHQTSVLSRNVLRPTTPSFMNKVVYYSTRVTAQVESVPRAPWTAKGDLPQ